MNSKFINAIMFAAGAAIGSAVTWKVVKTRYERIVQEEIKSINEAFSSQRSENQEQTDSGIDDENDEWADRDANQISWDELEDLDDDEDDEEVNDMDEYERLTGSYTNEKGGAENMAKEPYVIAPLDFGELDGYSQVELTYYEGDDTLEDDEGNIIDDRDELIGPKALTTFGEYEDDSVFVRNDRLRADFQILKDYRTYKEARSVGPDQVDDE